MQILELNDSYQDDKEALNSTHEATNVSYEVETIIDFTFNEAHIIVDGYRNG